jgi:hypothetical protein
MDHAPGLVPAVGVDVHRVRRPVGGEGDEEASRAQEPRRQVEGAPRRGKVLEDVAGEEHVERRLQLAGIGHHVDAELLARIARPRAAQLEAGGVEAGAPELPAAVAPRGAEVEDARALFDAERAQDRDALAEVLLGAGEATVDERAQLLRRRAVGGEPLLVVGLVEGVAEPAGVGGRAIEELAAGAAHQRGDEELPLQRRAPAAAARRTTTAPGNELAGRRAHQILPTLQRRDVVERSQLMVTSSEPSRPHTCASSA